MKNVAICIVDFGDKKYVENLIPELGFGGTFELEKNVRHSTDCITESILASLFIRDNNEDNIGFTLANNQLIKRAFSFVADEDASPAEWIWLLNNDTQVPRETLLALDNVLSSVDNKVGLIGFQIRSMDDKDLIHHAGTGDCFPTGVHKSGSAKLNQFNKPTNEKWVTFASVLIRREVFEDIGMLDGNMKFIGSDSDFCFRARNAGWKIVYEPKMMIYHKIGQSAANPAPEVSRQMQQDMDYFQNKWINGKLFFDLDKEVLTKWATLKLLI